MVTNNKIEHAYTSQNIKTQKCVMIYIWEQISIDEGDIKNPNKIPIKEKPTQFWGRRLELEKSIFKNSSTLVKKVVEKFENANENGDSKVLVTIFINHTEQICRETFLDSNRDNSSVPEWVTFAKSQMMEILGTCIECWWKDFI